MMTTQKIETNTDEKSVTPVKPITPPSSQSYLSFFWQTKEKPVTPKASTQPQTANTLEKKHEKPGDTTQANTALKTSNSVYDMSKEEYKEQPENVDIETASSIDPFLLDEPTLSYIGRIFKCLTMPGR